MRSEDVADVSRLLTKVHGEKSAVFPHWKETLQWLYFSLEIRDPIPRAWVIVNEHSVVGHIGLTLSELTDGERTYRVVQPTNWVIDPDYKTGLLSLRLMLDAVSLGEVAVIMDGTEETQRIVPKIGFRKQLDVGRYLKVMRPWSFVRRARTREQLTRNAGKLGVFLGSVALNHFSHPSSGRRRERRLGYHVVEVNESLDDRRGDGSWASHRSSPAVLRNTLRPEFLNWYKQCPRGTIQVLEVFGEDRYVGQAAILTKSRPGGRDATILNVDVVTDEDAMWIDILKVVEEFLQESGVTHINALGAYEPWRRALESQGHCRLKSIPCWVRDPSNRLTHIDQWHLTAIEGDLGYLFE